MVAESFRKTDQTLENIGQVLVKEGTKFNKKLNK